MQIRSPLADISLSIDSIVQDGSMVRLDATQQPGEIPTTAYLTPMEVAKFVATFLKPSFLLYLLFLSRHRRHIERGVGIPKPVAQQITHPTPAPW